MTEDGVLTEIERLGVRESHPGLCDLALSLARAVDTAEAPTALAAVAAQLRAVMLDLCKLKQTVAEGDSLDDLAARREARREARRRGA